MSRPSGSFSFPPPPPPPPAKFHSQGSDSFNAPSRGRGFSHGQRGAFQPNRGRGHGRGRGGGGGGGGGMAHVSNSPRLTSSGVASQNQKSNPINQPHKRSFGLAFGGAQAQSRPQAPPAVPSFNASLESLLPSKPVPPLTTKQSHAAPKKTNILGLTPSQDEGSESEDDGDEEAKFAPGVSSRDIQFEYKGNVSTLRTPADIAAWIAERRKRYPTQAKREAAQKEAEERKKKAEEERRVRQEARRQAREQRERDKKEKSGKLAAVGAATGKKKTAARASTTDQQAQVRLRAEKLRRKLEKAERTLAAIDEASQAERKHTTTAGESAVGVDSITSDSDPTTSSSSGNDDTSSSGSDSDGDSDSDSDSDSAPEELSSKLEPEDITAQSSITTAATPLSAAATGARVCSFFARGGRCKYGEKCRFSHVRTGTGTAEPTRTPRAARPAAAVVKRKGLWDVLVEKEREDENRKVLQAIIALGDAGMLEEKES